LLAGRSLQWRWGVFQGSQRQGREQDPTSTCHLDALVINVFIQALVCTRCSIAHLHKLAWAEFAVSCPGRCPVRAPCVAQRVPMWCYTMHGTLYITMHNAELIIPYVVASHRLLSDAASLERGQHVIAQGRCARSGNRSCSVMMVLQLRTYRSE
jgi:hypothetical protein